MLVKDEHDIEFDELLQERRHKELLAALRGLTANLSKKENIDVRIEGVSRLEDALKNFSIHSPDVNVEVNQKEVVASIKELGKTMLEVLQREEEKKEWEFTVHRSYGTIQTVTAKQIK